MDKDIIKKGVAAAEKEQQEKQVELIKNIVRSYLERIQAKTEERKKVDEEISALKKDLEDLRAGRLDKISERCDIDEKAREYSLLRIKKIADQYIPMQPWKSPYEVGWINAVTATTTDSQTNGVAYVTLTGTTFSNISQGAYQVNGHIFYL